jgi:hypothetical protein
LESTRRRPASPSRTAPRATTIWWNRRIPRRRAPRGARIRLTCHNGKSFHGDGSEPTNRFEAPNKPSCLDCHPDAAPDKGNVEAHNAHPEGTVDCYVCHATVNKSCYNCHVGEGAQSEADFKIGLNTRADWPYKYSVVRHMPGVSTMLDPFEPGLMADYDSVPHWKTTNAVGQQLPPKF